MVPRSYFIPKSSRLSAEQRSDSARSRELESPRENSSQQPVYCQPEHWVRAWRWPPLNT